MSLHADLLEQAERLANLDPGRPKQANLRRAVSAAYYALFHLLVSEASALYVTDSKLAARINRTINHGDIEAASSMMVQGKFPNALQDPNNQIIIPKALKSVAAAFVALQAERHQADYKLDRTFSRRQTIENIDMARQAFEDWGRVRKSDHARLYLACFLLAERWKKPPR